MKFVFNSITSMILLIVLLGVSSAWAQVGGAKNGVAKPMHKFILSLQPTISAEALKKLGQKKYTNISIVNQNYGEVIFSDGTVRYIESSSGLYQFAVSAQKLGISQPNMISYFNDLNSDLAKLVINNSSALDAAASITQSILDENKAMWMLEYEIQMGLPEYNASFATELVKNSMENLLVVSGSAMTQEISQQIREMFEIASSAATSTRTYTNSYGETVDVYHHTFENGGQYSEWTTYHADGSTTTTVTYNYDGNSQTVTRHDFDTLWDNVVDFFKGEQVESAKDSDGDGFSDEDEIAAGTDPNDPNSKPSGITNESETGRMLLTEVLNSTELTSLEVFVTSEFLSWVQTDADDTSEIDLMITGYFKGIQTTQKMSDYFVNNIKSTLKNATRLSVVQFFLR